MKRESSPGRTWVAAGAAAIALLAVWTCFGKPIAHLAPGFGGSIIVAGVLPFLFSLPVAWVSDDAGLAGVAFISCAGAAFLVWGLMTGAGEDLGPVIAALIASALIIPGAVLGVTAISLAKVIRYEGFSIRRPGRSAYLLLAFLLLPAILVLRYSRRMHQLDVLALEEPVSATDAQLRLAVKAKSRISDEQKHGSQQHYLAGVIQFEKRNFNGAIREWKTAVVLDPGNADAHAALARLGADDGK